VEGLVTKTTGSWYIVRTGSGEHYKCKLKGRFKIKGIKTTNPIAVGDRVDFDLPSGQDVGVITNIHERDNYIIRKATRLSKIFSIIAANIDQAFLVVTVALPRTSIGFIDRFLTIAEAYHIPSQLIFNKVDIYDDKLKKLHEKYESLYSGVGYSCHSVSALTGENIDKLHAVLKRKINLFSGHSGVGKSALINRLDPSLNLKTGELSGYHQKGKHTTTFTEMIELPSGGFIIDTPGIKEFGIIDFEPWEVSHRFPEMRVLLNDCRFNNCLHVHESQCAVKQALEDGKISPIRYQSYLNILNHVEEEGLQEWEME